MRLFKGEPLHNRLLLAIPPARLERMADNFRLEALEAGRSIDRIDEPVRHLHFVNRGFVSMVKTMRDGRSIEVGGIGVEGVTSPHVVLWGESAILDAIVQIPGAAFRIARDALAREISAHPELRHILERYAHFVLGQVAQTAACNRLHTLEQRCCRWLLVAHDNALADRFALTHEFLAVMLGVHRPSVSMEANALRKAGLIDYRRATITVRDRKGLEARACECYASHRDELDTLLGPAVRLAG